MVKGFPYIVLGKNQKYDYTCKGGCHRWDIKDCVSQYEERYRKKQDPYGLPVKYAVGYPVLLTHALHILLGKMCGARHVLAVQNPHYRKKYDGIEYGYRSQV